MNIDPPPPTAGFVIVLNGASSSGKSSLVRRVQALLDLPFLLISGDQLIEAGLLPARRDPQGPFDWLGQMRPRPPATPESTEATSATASLPHEERVAPRTRGSCGRS